MVSVGAPWGVSVAWDVSADHIRAQLAGEGFDFNVINVDAVGAVGDDVKFHQAFGVDVPVGGYFKRFGPPV